MIDHPHILSIGEVLWDLFPDGARFGGAAANFACHAAFLGGEVSLLSATGDDHRGISAVEILRRFGVNVAFVQCIAAVPTGSVNVSLDAAGKPCFEIHQDSAWDRIQWSAGLEAHIPNVDAFYFGTLSQRSEGSRATIRQVLKLAKTYGVLRVLDVNLRKPYYDAAMIRDSISLASVLKLSDEELPEIVAACGISPLPTVSDTLQAVRERSGLDCIVMTCGAEGALMISADGAVTQPGIPSKVVDTVGAGDSFTAALVCGLLRGEPHQQTLRKACETASAVCAHSGAVPIRFKTTTTPK